MDSKSFLERKVSYWSLWPLVLEPPAQLLNGAKGSLIVGVDALLKKLLMFLFNEGMGAVFTERLMSAACASLNLVAH